MQNDKSHVSSGSLSRRQFIQSALVGSAAVSGWLGQVRATQATGKLKMGLIGAGWWGMVDVNAAFKVGGVEFVAVCDVDSQHLKSSADKIEKLQGTRPQTFKHYQDLLQVSELQAVIIATPPHWHALPFLAALGAIEAGHKAEILILGEATYLMHDYVVDQVDGVGWPPLRDLMPKVIEHGIPIHV